MKKLITFFFYDNLSIKNSKGMISIYTKLHWEVMKQRDNASKAITINSKLDLSLEVNLAWSAFSLVKSL